jgi:hypothetical protein
MDNGIDQINSQQCEGDQGCSAERVLNADISAQAQAPGTVPQEEIVPPLSLVEEYSHVVTALEDIERKLRLKHNPKLIERAAPLEVDDLRDLQQQQREGQQMETTTPIKDSTTATISEDGTVASLRKRGLKEVFAIDHRILTPPHFGFQILLSLDVSNNELTDLPGLSALKNLRTLDLNRNWFNTLPSELGALNHLQTLVAARNFLKPNQQSLRLEMLRTSCPSLSILDLRYNQKCCRPLHRDRVREALLPLEPTIDMTLWEEEAHGNNNNSNSNQNNYVGSSAAQRDPVLLRSQLEPLGTVALRKRLVCDFGREPTDPTKVDRAGVMRDLLKAYFDEGLACFPEHKSNGNGDGNDNGDDNGTASNVNRDPDILDYDYLVANRKSFQLYGIPVPEDKLQALMTELQKWTAHTGLVNKNRERPSIHASNYMILRRPTEPKSDTKPSSKPISRRALRKAQKRERYLALWVAGINALNAIDPVFARQNCTEIAITHGFSGSPHRDKQNCGPFYGLSLGNFDDSDGKGGIVVEASARVVIRVNTKCRLGRVDGRYVHWVAPWGTKHGEPSNQQSQKQQPPSKLVHGGEEQQRYSLIYYETGHQFVPPGPAVFSIPEHASGDEV